MEFRSNKTNLRKHLAREKNLARNRLMAVKVGNTNMTLYNMIRSPNIEKIGNLLETHRKQAINRPGMNPTTLKKEFYFGNGILGVQNIAHSYLYGLPVNKSKWVGNFAPQGVRNTSNKFEIKKPVPVIAYNKNGRYVGHVWREGAPPSETGSNTAKFIGIQKTLDPNVRVPKVAPALLRQVEKELGELGYKRMATFPRRVMSTIMYNMGWPNMNRHTSLVTKTIGRQFRRENVHKVNSLVPAFSTINNLMNNTKYSRNDAQKLLNALKKIKVNYPKRIRFIKYLENKLARPKKSV